jgi:hypothetical protein
MTHPGQKSDLGDVRVTAEQPHELSWQEMAFYDGISTFERILAFLVGLSGRIYPQHLGAFWL